MRQAVASPVGNCRSAAEESHFSAAVGWSLWAGIALLATVAFSKPVAGLGLAFDLVANVSYFASIPLFVVATVAALTGRWRAAAAAVTSGIFAAAPVLCLPGSLSAARDPQHPSASVMLCNIRGNASAWDELRKLIRRFEPDVLAIVEAENAVVDRIIHDEEINADYPFRVLPRPGLEWPQVILSRHRLTPVELPADASGTVGWTVFSAHLSQIVELPLGRVIFSLEHPPSPRSFFSWQRGNLQIEALGRIVRNHFELSGLPAVIAGDFNTSPAGYRHGLMRSKTGLHPDPETCPPVGTWPSAFPKYLRLPLDRVWGSSRVRFLSRQVLKDVGSDHRPILVRFRLDSQN